jgi:hypothetical protein
MVDQAEIHRKAVSGEVEERKEAVEQLQVILQIYLIRCKERGDSMYKLCEVKEGCEEVIIADFNLDYKGAQVPTPSNPNKVLKSVDNIKKIPIQPDRSRSKVGNE